MGLVVVDPVSPQRTLVKRWVYFCDTCGEPFHPFSNGSALVMAGKTACICHSEKCREARRIQVSENSSLAMKSKLENGLLERMKVNNPMNNPTTRAKVSATLRRIGHKPAIHGGNGEYTVPQLALFGALGDGWVLEFPILTGCKKGKGDPTNIKADLAHPGLMIVVEVDGGSHNCLKVREQDRRKEMHLSRLKWSVLRFKNQEVNSNLLGCLARIEELKSSILKLKETIITLPKAS